MHIFFPLLIIFARLIFNVFLNSMKRIFLSLLMLFAFTGGAVAQNTIDKGDLILSLGIGLGRNYYSGFNMGVTPTFSLGLQYGIAKLGPGTVTLGGLVGFSSSSYDDNWNRNYGYRHTWTNFSIGIRSEWHYNFNVDNLDFYLGMMIGTRIESYSVKWNSGKPNDWDDRYSKNYGGAHLIFGPHVGLAYYLGKNVGLFGEFGYGINWATFGVNFKF